jgi:hypothetical protein
LSVTVIVGLHVVVVLRSILLRMPR